MDASVPRSPATDTCLQLTGEEANGGDISYSRMSSKIIVQAQYLWVLLLKEKFRLLPVAWLRLSVDVVQRVHVSEHTAGHDTRPNHTDRSLFFDDEDRYALHGFTQSTLRIHPLRKLSLLENLQILRGNTSSNVDAASRHISESQVTDRLSKRARPLFHRHPAEEVIISSPMNRDDGRLVHLVHLLFDVRVHELRMLSSEKIVEVSYPGAGYNTFLRHVVDLNFLALGTHCSSDAGFEEVP
mmetsp:Transcript_10741/g.14918  ORF Transcript_10741/g.14918 Transcript_10741/m.14918 type:complete len:241 (-) Transcript_10741:913-1635(-)